jgi:rod shape determining protein RodA
MRITGRTDWLMVGSAFLISLAGLSVMYGFGNDTPFAGKQLIWLVVAVLVFFAASTVDFRFLRRTATVVIIYVTTIALLLLLFAIGAIFHGAQSWFDLGAFSVQPVDLAELALIIVLAKYFSRRHIEIARVKHILISGFYTFLVFVLLFLQPDFGSAVIVAGLWIGMVLVAGIPVRHLALIVGIGVTAGALLWTFAFADYQKARIVTFLHPLADISGAGYNAFQSTVAVGSGGLFGKGIGYGTQSRLSFLPEHETDFIFAAFAEEWGLIGTALLLALFGVLLYRLVANAQEGATNFETLFTLGVALLFTVHGVIHIGMNIGLLPVTGTTLPFMSYGGSHLVVGYLMLGIVNAMRRYSSVVHEDERHEMVGVG